MVEFLHRRFAAICTVAGLVWVQAAETSMLHNADTIDGIQLSWGESNPEARLERNTDPRFVREGTGSILARSKAPRNATGTSYVGFRIPVSQLQFGGRALAFEAWSSEPRNTIAFYVRGLTAKGKIAAGWSSWSYPLTERGRTFTLVPEQRTGPLTWETSGIDAKGEDIAFVEFIAGCVKKGATYNMFIDQIRLLDAPPLPPPNTVIHGLVAPVGMPTWGRSTIATVGEKDERIVFTKLWTGHRASYLFIDAQTGETEQVFPKASGWGAYSVIMTPGNVVYDTMGEHLVAIDVSTRNVRKLGSFGSGMALSYTRSEDGTVYAGIYPSATLVSYQPATETFVNYGPLNTEEWPQYLRPLALDDAGWVYGGIGQKEGLVVGFQPETGAKASFIPADKRRRGNPTLYRAVDGSVYADAPGWGLHRLHNGKATPVETGAAKERGPDLDVFPDGSRITGVKIPDRQLFIRDAVGETPREVRFDYKSGGVNIYTLIAGPDGRIHGATGIPLRVWAFDPAKETMWNSGLGGYGGHINQFARQGDLLYGAVYSSGNLLEYDPRQPFHDAPMAKSRNPRLAFHSPKARDLYGRPHAVLAHPDGRHVLVGGNAARVLLGSGLLVYDVQEKSGTILDRSQLIPDHGINAMVALPGGDVLVGTTIRPPTAGTPGPAKTALLYRFDLEKRTVVERWPLRPDTPAVRDMIVASDGKVYGLAEPGRLFVFDPAAGQILHDEVLDDYGPASGYQAPRCMTNGPDGAIYALFRNAVVRIEPGTREHKAIAWPKAPITSGIAIMNGRLYFGCGPTLCSCSLRVPEPIGKP